MKRIFLGMALLLVSASAGWSEWHGFSRPDNISVQPIATRDIYNGQWLAGYSVDLLYYKPTWLSHIYGLSQSQFYVAIEHQYNAAELTPLDKIQNAAGVFGGGAGLSIGGLASTVSNLFHAIVPPGAPSLAIPDWLMNDLDNWITVECNGGYRVFGHSVDVSPWVAGIGGKVTIRFDVTAHH